jgi:hypothetical protein
VGEDLVVANRGSHRVPTSEAPVLIDAHTHTQPTAADKADFDEWSGVVDRSRTGCVDELLSSMAGAGIAHTMIVPWLPAQQLVAAQVVDGTDRDVAVAAVVDRWLELNRWAAAAVRAHPGELSCLVGLDPVLMSPATMASAVADGLADGAIGIKVAPMFLNIRPDDEQMEPVWQLADQHSVFVLSEACGFVDFPGFVAWGHPSHFDAVLRSYSRVPIQLAHLGVGAEDEVARLTARYDNVYADLSMRFGGPVPIPYDPQETLRQVRSIGAERVLFGTNYPVVDQAGYVQKFAALGLTDAEQRLVGGENARRLFGLRPGEASPAS